ncbi:MAG: L-arabinose isomerase [Kiritimatiellia bacterium]|jgi:L-arabinose isomerase|nr:L-arabinose isomerase [Kiritimatiellia bacterium]
MKTGKLWFVTGSQHLYGEETLKQVAADSRVIAEALSACAEIPSEVLFKPVLKTPDEISACCRDAEADPDCGGLVTWMHTFSPAKMWIAGLGRLKKPFVHLHTQFNRDIPWAGIDMDFMNLNQSAHGGREFGYICSRMRKNRKVVVGHWEDPDVLAELGDWARAALAWQDSQDMKVARFGDNMREVAVTEGDKVEAQLKFGYSVNGFGMGDLAVLVDGATDAEVDKLVAEYSVLYAMGSGSDNSGSLREAARVEIGMRAFLEDGGFTAFTTTFENLTGLNQLPGLAVQRLMADGYGFGAEGDWKTAALLRSIKVMGEGLDGGASFMEDYTYHLDGKGMKVLGAHMLEVCPSTAQGKPSLEVHPLGIGGKADPARLVFNVAPGPAINVTVIDMGDRFRMIVNEVDVIEPESDMPNLPVARALWVPQPDLKIAATAWIYGGGAHHTAFSAAATTRHILDFAEIADVECLVIDKETNLHAFKKELRWNDAALRSRQS